MARRGRPPVDTGEIMRYLMERGPQPRTALVAAAERGELTLAPSSVKHVVVRMLEQGEVAQRGPRGDYYPVRDPDTGEAVHVVVVRGEELEVLRRMREGGERAQVAVSSTG